MGSGPGSSGVSDPDAFTVLVEQCQTQVYAYLARRAPAHAEDLLARVWVEAYSARHGYDPSLGSARAWLFGVARHVLHRHWREQASAPRGHSLSAADEPAIDPWDEVDRHVDSAALAVPLRRALSELPDVDREMLLLIAWEQLTPTEAAAVVGVPPGTARTRLHRARSRMRAAMAADAPAVANLLPTIGGPDDQP